MLQNALLKEVDQSHIRLSSRLIDVQHDAFGKAIIIFEDGYRDTVDLVIGADGIRSVVRTRAFPSYPITYTGRISYRTLISAQAVASQTSIPDAVTFWHGKNGVWVYTCPLNNNLFEITTMAREPPEGKDRVSWGQEATIQQMTDHYRDFHPQILKVLSIPTHVQQYAAFAGPRLSTVISSSPFSTALIGDASHPLSGAFGSGAGFALEDGWTIAQSLLWAHRNNKGLDEALKLFDEVRSPHYRALYDVMDSFAKAEGELQAKQSSGEIVGVDEEISFRVAANWSEEHVWMHHYDVRPSFLDHRSVLRYLLINHDNRFNQHFEKPLQRRKSNHKKQALPTLRPASWAIPTRKTSSTWQLNRFLMQKLLIRTGG